MSDTSIKSLNCFQALRRDFQAYRNVFPLIDEVMDRTTAKAIGVTSLVLVLLGAAVLGGALLVGNDTVIDWASKNPYKMLAIGSSAGLAIVAGIYFIFFHVFPRKPTKSDQPIEADEPIEAEPALKADQVESKEKMDAQLATIEADEPIEAEPALKADQVESKEKMDAQLATRRKICALVLLLMVGVGIALYFVYNGEAMNWKWPKAHPFEMAVIGASTALAVTPLFIYFSSRSVLFWRYHIKSEIAAECAKQSRIAAAQYYSQQINLEADRNSDDEMVYRDVDHRNGRVMPRSGNLGPQTQDSSLDFGAPVDSDERMALLGDSAAIGPRGSSLGPHRDEYRGPASKSGRRGSLDSQTTVDTVNGLKIEKLDEEMAYKLDQADMRGDGVAVAGLTRGRTDSEAEECADELSQRSESPLRGDPILTDDL